jgi:transposase
LREIGFLQEEIECIDSKLAGIAKDDKNVRLLITIPGVDYYSALAILSEIGDIRRFPDAKKLTSYAGLVSSTRRSNKIIRHGHITKEGPEILRWILICDTHAAVKREGKLNRFYKRLSKRIGANKAIVATARKMLVIIYHMLVNQSPYEERDDDLTYRKFQRMLYKARYQKKKKQKQKEGRTCIKAENKRNRGT